MMDQIRNKQQERLNDLRNLPLQSYFDLCLEKSISRLSILNRPINLMIPRIPFIMCFFFLEEERMEIFPYIKIRRR